MKEENFSELEKIRRDAVEFKDNEEVPDYLDTLVTVTFLKSFKYFYLIIYWHFTAWKFGCLGVFALGVVLLFR